MKKNKNNNKEFGLSILFIFIYILFILLCTYILTIKSYINEFNYINSDYFNEKSDSSLGEYMFKRFICGKYCIFSPAIDKGTSYYDRDANLGNYIYILWLILIILPIIYLNLYGLTKSKSKTYRKFKEYYYNKLFQLIILSIFLFTIFV